MSRIIKGNRKAFLAILGAGVFMIAAAGCATEDPSASSDEARLSSDQPRTGAQSDELAIPGAEGTKRTFKQTSESEVTPPPPALPPGGITAHATASFWATCLAPKEVDFTVINGTAAATFAASAGCRRFNGTFGGFTSWSGVCFGDVSNCNGTLVCQSHCP